LLFAEEILTEVVAAEEVVVGVEEEVVVVVEEEEVVQQTLEEVNNKDQPEGLVVEGLEAAAAAATDETPKLSHKGDRNYKAYYLLMFYN
jgi:hypothetical protein